MVVQSDFAPIHGTRMVAPLIPAQAAPRANDMTPTFLLEGDDHVMTPQFMFAIETRLLGRPVANLAAHRDEITRALDLLFTGF